MAPEVVQKHQHDASVDYWSFGVLLFEMLTGDLPYRHKQKKKMLEMIAQAKKPKFPKFLGSVSRTANRQAAFSPRQDLPQGVLGCVLCSSARLVSSAPTLCAQEAVGIIKLLMNKLPSARPTAADLKLHPFFAGMDWKKLLALELEPPLVPEVAAGPRDIS